MFAAEGLKNLEFDPCRLLPNCRIEQHFHYCNLLYRFSPLSYLELYNRSLELHYCVELHVKNTGNHLPSIKLLILTNKQRGDIQGTKYSRKEKRS